MGRGQSFLQGALILMAAAVGVKVVGALFKIPLSNLIGGEGMGYFNTAYGLFTPVYALSVSGFPVAVARLVARNGQQGRFTEIRRVLRVSIALFLLTGSLGLIVLVLGAARFAARYVTLSDVVEERRLAVVDVTHDRDYGRTSLHFFFAVLNLSKFVEFVLCGGILFELERDPVFERDELSGFKVDAVVDRSEFSHIKKFLDDLGGRFSDLFAENFYRDRVGIDNGMFDDYSLRSEAFFFVRSADLYVPDLSVIFVSTFVNVTFFQQIALAEPLLVVVLCTGLLFLVVLFILAVGCLSGNFKNAGLGTALRFLVSALSAGHTGTTRGSVVSLRFLISALRSLSVSPSSELCVWINVSSGLRGFRLRSDDFSRLFGTLRRGFFLRSFFNGNGFRHSFLNFFRFRNLFSLIFVYGRLCVVLSSLGLKSFFFFFKTFQLLLSLSGEFRFDPGDLVQCFSDAGPTSFRFLV